MKWRLGILLIAAAAFIAPLPPATVEQLYAQTLFPHIQSTLTMLTNTTAVAWLDVLIALAIVWVVAVAIRDLRRTALAGVVIHLLVRLVTVVAAAYLVFLVTWGLNYRRQPMRNRVHFDSTRVSADGAAALAQNTVQQLNMLYGSAHAQAWNEPLEIDASLSDAFVAATRRLGLPGGIVVGRPKHSAFDLYFRRAGIAGMTDPFLLETLVASDLLPFERPSVVAHEWGHLAGLTNEGEASFLGWLTCINGTAPNQYSGWLSLYGEVMEGLPPDAAGRISAGLASGPRSDLDAAQQRSAREVSPRLSSAGWQVYDQYLKANRIEAGTRSYAEVVQLILGTGLK